MVRLMWLEFNTQGESLEVWLKRVNALKWNIGVEKYKDQWIVKSGEQDVFRSDSYEAVEAFLYGLSIAYTIIPDDIFAEFQEKMNSR
jgi:hypothetical protein